MFLQFLFFLFSTFFSQKNIVKKPRLTRLIRGGVKAAWQRSLNAGKFAVCNQKECSFSSKSMNEMEQHFLMCNFIPNKVNSIKKKKEELKAQKLLFLQNFVCKICNYEKENEKEMVEHVKENHICGDYFESDSCSSSEPESIHESSHESSHEETCKIKPVKGKPKKKVTNELSNEGIKI